jgi:dTDP-glucose 4,6-dehydratase
VSDLIEGILRLSRSEEHLPTNIGNPTEFTILECAKVILEVTRSKSEICFGPLPQDDPSRRKPDISKAKRVLGWEPRIDLREGLKLSIEYFRESLNARAVEPDYVFLRSSKYSGGAFGELVG